MKGEFTYTLNDEQTGPNWLDIVRILERIGWKVMPVERRPDGGIRKVVIFPNDQKTPTDTVDKAIGKYFDGKG
jgi:hypothetical protein